MWFYTNLRSMFAEKTKTNLTVNAIINTTIWKTLQNAKTRNKIFVFQSQYWHLTHWYIFSDIFLFYFPCTISQWERFWCWRKINRSKPATQWKHGNLKFKVEVLHLRVLTKPVILQFFKILFIGFCCCCCRVVVALACCFVFLLCYSVVKFMLSATYESHSSE